LPLVVRPLVVPLVLPLLVMPLVLLPLGMVPPPVVMPLLVMPLVLLPLGMVPPSGLMVPLALASGRREPFMPDESALMPESAVVPLLPLEPQALSRVVLNARAAKKTEVFLIVIMAN
jgi:hypothetical protein